MFILESAAKNNDHCRNIAHVVLDHSLPFERMLFNACCSPFAFLHPAHPSGLEGERRQDLPVRPRLVLRATRRAQAAFHRFQMNEKRSPRSHSAHSARSAALPTALAEKAEDRDSGSSGMVPKIFVRADNLSGGLGRKQQGEVTLKAGILAM